MISKTFRASLAVVAILFGGAAAAQRMEPGYAPQLRAEPVAPALHAVPYSQLTLAPVDPAEVDQVRAANAQPGLKALQIGIPRDVSPQPAAALAWTQAD